MRLANLDDLFDGVPETSPTFDLQFYASELYRRNNGLEDATSIEITERTLGDNQDFEEWTENRISWKSEDDSANRFTPEWPQDIDLSHINLQP